MKQVITPNLFPKFFALFHKATLALGLTSKDEQQRYYKSVLADEGKYSSIKELPSLASYEACLTRFAADAQEFQCAVDPETEKQKRRAYVLKVLVLQILQLEGQYNPFGVTLPKNARNYLEGVFRQAIPGIGFHEDGDNYWMDVSAQSLLLAIKICDTRLRKLKHKYFPTFPMSFDDRIKYTYYYTPEGATILRESVDKWYYSKVAFRVSS